MTTREPRQARNRWLSGFGELLITAGIVLALFVVWQNWWTDMTAQKAFAVGRTSVVDAWGARLDADGIPGPARPLPAPSGTAGSSSSGSSSSGSGSSVSGGGKQTSSRKPIKTIGLMFVPALQKRDLWGQPIVEGTSNRALNQGVGHYPGSARPGGIGNMSIAGHRTTHGAPFRHLDKLKRGDRVIIRMKDTWYIYALDKSKVVRPKENWVLKSRPWRNARGRLITLTTCHPVGSAARRLVWWGHLVRTQPATKWAPKELKWRR